MRKERSPLYVLQTIDTEGIINALSHFAERLALEPKPTTYRTAGFAPVFDDQDRELNVGVYYDFDCGSFEPAQRIVSGKNGQIIETYQDIGQPVTLVNSWGNPHMVAYQIALVRDAITSYRSQNDYHRVKLTFAG